MGAGPRWVLRWLLAGLLAPWPAMAEPLVDGDLLVGSMAGRILQYRDSRPVGTVQVVQAPYRVRGLCQSTRGDWLFAALDHGTDASGALYRIDRQGRVVDGSGGTSSWVHLAEGAPQACTTGRGGEVYLAIGGSHPKLVRVDADGQRTGAWQPPGIGASRSVSLGADACVLSYASGGVVRRFDVCAGAALPDAGGALAGRFCRAVRQVLGGQALVACDGEALRVDAGWQLQSRHAASLCRADDPALAASTYYDAVNSSPDDRLLYGAVPRTGLHVGRICSVAMVDGRFDNFVESGDEQLSVAVVGEPQAAQQRCFRLFFGRLVCLGPLLRRADWPLGSLSEH